MEFAKNVENQNKVKIVHKSFPKIIFPQIKFKRFHISMEVWKFAEDWKIRFCIDVFQKRR